MGIYPDVIGFVLYKKSLKMDAGIGCPLVKMTGMDNLGMEESLLLPIVLPILLCGKISLLFWNVIIFAVIGVALILSI